MKEIATRTFLMLHKIIEQHQPQNDSLLGGRLGLALYYQALYDSFDKPAHAEKATALLEEVFSNLTKNSMQLSGNAFGGGGAGLGYVAAQFYTAGFIEASLHDDLESLDDYLYKTSLEQIIQQDKIDFLHGATGTIHYFVKRMPDKKAERYLVNLITALCNKAVREEKGIWFKNLETERKENSGINLSLSHGLCGFLLILINAYHAGIKLDCIKEKISRGIAFILSYQQDIDIPKKKWSFFPNTINAADLSDLFLSQRLAWCYGDFGPILLLYKAAAIIDMPEWIDKANLFGTFTIMRRDAEATVTTQTLFCHGTAGMAQVYDTFYKLSGIDRYKTAQEYWIGQTTEMIPGELEKAIYYGKECDLLEGLVGVNLALLSYISEKPLTWSQAFLLE
ncbi:MAG TPA: lanthionine synthetase LanC family protein [Chitinophagaceae bacterium]|nr:lanthionine synthetase LanC family protein [Chitinophagaceae bacterium]